MSFLNGLDKILVTFSKNLESKYFEICKHFLKHIYTLEQSLNVNDIH